MINPTNIPECLKHDCFWDKSYAAYSEKAFGLLRQWIKDAIKDGWKAKPSYSHESLERAATLTINIDEDKYIIRTIAREASSLSPAARSFCSIYGWRNELHFIVPVPYNRQKLIENSYLCDLCGQKIEGEPLRFSFAGQSCRREACTAKAAQIDRNTDWD